MNDNLKVLTLLAAVLLPGGNLQASGKIDFKGVVIQAPDCTFNGGEAIVVDFGDEVVTWKIDGKKYKKVVNHGLLCEGHRYNKMKVKIKGDTAIFDPDALKTTIGELAILININQKAVAVNTWTNISYKDSFVMEVIPVKKEGSELDGGDFTAMATMMVDYE